MLSRVFFVTFYSNNSYFISDFGSVSNTSISYSIINMFISFNYFKDVSLIFTPFSILSYYAPYIIL